MLAMYIHVCVYTYAKYLTLYVEIAPSSLISIEEDKLYSTCTHWSFTHTYVATYNHCPSILRNYEA